MFSMIIILLGVGFYFFNKPSYDEFESSPSKDNKIDNNLINNITIFNNNVDITLNEYGLELPINNATGYTSIEMELLNEEKGVIQTLYQLTDGSGLKLTTEQYFTPKHNEINGKGIEPDIVVDDYSFNGTLDEENDTQLQKAIEILNK